MKKDSNVIHISSKYPEPKITAGKVLTEAVDKLEFVFIAGEDKDGQTYFASNSSTVQEMDRILWLIEKFKFKLMNGDFS